MKDAMQQKVTADHLKRDAYLYIRQSTLHQVLEHTESTKRQYALRQRAVALGWPLERVIVIDCDQGLSGAAADRAGFARLVAEVGMGKAGIVLGLEVSRLARSSTDWHRLLEICALTETLILDEDGIYDPGHFNDRLLLGLKGTMSEAELHVLKARLVGGVFNKARRGELKAPLPVGLEYGPDDRVVLDPDGQVQQAIRVFFEAFRRTGSACGTVREFRERKLLFPSRIRTGPRKGLLNWTSLQHSRALEILHNPRYAGAFFFGRTRTHHTAEGSTVEQIPRDRWHSLLPSAHVGYISWEEYEENQRRLRENAQANGCDRRHGPPREGPALLQGLVQCGKCGERMTVRYHLRRNRLVPDYICQRRGIERSEPICQDVPGWDLDKAVGKLLVELFTPMALEVSLAVQQQLNDRAAEADRLRRQRVERARYEADLAERRYMRVDPDNRLVADALEGDWNEKLRSVAEAQEEYERGCQVDRRVLDEGERADILALATDFPRLWSSPETPDRERKRMVRLLIEDVTLARCKEVTAYIRFKGGATRSLAIPLPGMVWEQRQPHPDVIREIDRLLDNHTEGETAELLNQRGFRPGVAPEFRNYIVQNMCRSYGLKDRFTRLREKGMLTVGEMAAILGTCTSTVKGWHAAGLLRGTPFNDKNECLYEHPGDHPLVKRQGSKLSKRLPALNPSNTVNEV